MPTKTVGFITQGPAAGKIVQLSPADLAKGVKEGWAEVVSSRKHVADREAKNPAAEKYFSKLPGYQTRELRASENPVAEPVVGSVADSTAGEASPAAEPAKPKGRPGRKPKATTADAESADNTGEGSDDGDDSSDE